MKWTVRYYGINITFTLGVKAIFSSSSLISFSKFSLAHYISVLFNFSGISVRDSDIWEQECY